MTTPLEKYALRRRGADDVRLSMNVELITPMVGGGAVARMVDEGQPVNGKTIRGQLRFWWRATRAGRYGDQGLTAMKRDEDWLFGKAATFDPEEIKRGLGPSRVQVTVRTVTAGRVTEYSKGLAPDYVAFPLPANPKQGTAAARLLESLTFTVDLTVAAARLEGGPLSRDAVEADLKAAVWAWIHFGGVGARTRRGFGALRIADQPLTARDLRAALTGHVLPGSAPAGVPQLSSESRDTVILDRFDNPKQAWRTGVEVYRDFRNFRRGSGREPGRSYWPEPDEIRRITRESAEKHRQPVTTAQKFPRAAFGLPVIFHFRSDGPRRGEPRDTTLRGSKSDRLASPLILKPAGRDLLIATVLRTSAHPQHPLSAGQLVLKTGRMGDVPVRHHLTPAEAQELLARVPQQDREGSAHRFSPNLPTSFLRFLEEEIE